MGGGGQMDAQDVVTTSKGVGSCLKGRVLTRAAP